MAEDALSLRAAFPIGNHLAGIGVDVFLADVVGLQLTGVQRVEVFHRVARQFGEGGHRLGHRSTLTHNQFVRTDIDGLLLANLIEILGTQDAVGHLAIVLLIERRLDERTFDGERGGRVDALLVQSLHTVIHSPLVLGVL